MSRARPEYPDASTAARKAFGAWVDGSLQGRRFGQLLVRHLDGDYELRHVEDVEAEGLKHYENPREAREISKLTGSGEYRPLKSSPNLKRGWMLRVKDDRELAVAMGYFYPAGIVHWHMEREERLETTSFRENAARQSGIYARIRHLSDDRVQSAAKACCEDSVCLKRTLWDVDDETQLEMDRGVGEIPCPEPCSVFVSFARRVRMFEREGENAVDGSGFTPSEREDLAALVEAGAIGKLEMAREAEFEKPLNERRLRYRALTLLPRLRSEKQLDSTGQ